MQDTFPLVISVTSGKGGVGKTNLSVNLAAELAKHGKRVVLLDADLGLANVDVLLGLTPPKNIFHLFHENTTIQDILFKTPYGFSILPASSGLSEMLSLDTGQKLELLEALDVLEEEVDFLLVDTGAGINDNVLYFNLAAQERLVILTPEPTSLTDAYALIKVLKSTHGVEHFKVIINMAHDKRAGKVAFSRLYQACEHFLSGVSLDLVGIIPRDTTVRQSVVQQLPLTISAPQSPAAEAIATLAKEILEWETPKGLDGNIKFFWKKLLFHQ